MGKQFERALVVGASSGMGKEIARQLAAAGTQVALVARREPELAALAQQLGGGARIYPHDVACVDDVPALFQTICRDLGGLDLIVYAAGVMPKVAIDEYNVAKDRHLIEVNVLGAVAWLNETAKRFAAGGGGTIVGIGSVAGDRGRAPQPVYGATKAFLETYLESLRNRLGTGGVRVVTIKPGPIDTPMTADIALPKFPVEAAARQILAAAQGGRQVVYVPGKWRLIMAVIRALPSPVMQRLKK